MTEFPPEQAPAWQVSLCVQALPSLQAVPLGLLFVFSRIVTLSEYLFATAKSDLPSRLKSATATELGPEPAPTGEPAAWANAPVPFPSRIVAFLEPEFATARSALPSRLKSPTATEKGP